MQHLVRKLRKRQALERVATVARLLREWDPLAIADIAPKDEYNTYAPPVVSLVAQGANAWRVAQYLSEVQREHMGVPDTPAKNLVFAERIVQSLALKA